MLVISSYSWSKSFVKNCMEKKQKESQQSIESSCEESSSDDAIEITDTSVAENIASALGVSPIKSVSRRDKAAYLHKFNSAIRKSLHLGDNKCRKNLIIVKI